MSTFDAIGLRARAATYGEGLAAHLGCGGRLRPRRPERVWSWLERTRAAALIVSSPTDDDEDTGLALSKLRAAAARAAELGPDRHELVEAQRDVVRAEHELRAVSWQRGRAQRYRSAEKAEPTLGQSPTGATLERIQADLGSVGLIQYGIVDGATIAVAVTSHQRVFVPLGDFVDSARAGRELAFALRRLGRSRTGASSEAASAASRRLPSIGSTTS